MLVAPRNMLFSLKAHTGYPLNKIIQQASLFGKFV